MAEQGGHLKITASLDSRGVTSGTQKLNKQLNSVGSGTAGAGASAVSGSTSAQNKYNAALNDGNKALKSNNEMSQRQIDTARRQAYALSVAGYQAQALGQQALAAVNGWIDAFAKIDYQARRAVASFDMASGSAAETAKSVDMVIAASNDLARSFGMFDATTVAEGLYFYASTTGTVVKNQRDLNTVMKQFTPIMQAAGITSTNLETAIKGVNGIVNEFGMSMSDIPDIMSKLYSVTQKSAAEMTNYFEAFKMVGPIAKQMGATFDDTLIILSELSDEQIKGGMAGRALRQTLTKMVDPSDRARKALDALFASTLGVGQTFNSVMKKGGSFVSYRTYIDQLTQSLAKQTPARRAEILAIMSTQNEMAPLISTIEAGIDSYNRYGKSLFETSKYAEVLKNAQKDFDKDLETIARSAEASRGRITASFEAIKIALGNSMAPALATSADAMELFSKGLEKAITSNKLVAGAIGGFTMLSGAILTVVGSMLVLAGTFALLRVGYKEVRLMSAEMADNAGWQAMRKQAALYQRQLRYILNTKNKWSAFSKLVTDPIAAGFAKLKNAWNSLTKFMKAKLIKVWDFTQPIRTPVRNAVLGSIRSASDAVGSGVTRASGYAQRVTAPIRARISQATALPGRAMDYLQRRVTTARASQRSIVRRGIDFVEQRPSVQKFYGAISEQGTMTPSQAIPKAAMRKATAAWESFVLKGGNAMIRALEGGEKFLVNTLPGFKNQIIKGWESFIVRGGDAMIRALDGLFNGVNRVVVGIENGYSRAIVSGYKSMMRVSDAYLSMGDNIAKAIIDSIEKTKSIANSMKVVIKNTFVRTKKFFTKDISAAASRFREAFKSFIRDTPNMLRAALDRTKQFFGSDLGQFLSKAKSSTVRFATNTSSALVQSVNSLKTTIVKNIVSPLTRLGEAMRSLNISKNVNGFFGKMRNSLIDFGKMAMQRVKALNISLAPIAKRITGRSAVQAASAAVKAPGSANFLAGGLAAIKPALGIALQTIKSWAGRAFSLFKVLGTKIVKVVKGILSPFAVIAEVVIGFITGLFKGFATNTNKNLEDIGYTAKKTGEDINVLKSIFEVLILPIKALIFIFDVIRLTMEFLGVMTAKLVQGIMSLGDTIPFIKGIGDAFGWVGSVASGIGDIFTSITSGAQKAIDDIANGTTEMTAKLGDNQKIIDALNASRVGKNGIEMAQIDAQIVALEEKNRLLREALDLIVQSDPGNAKGTAVTRKVATPWLGEGTSYEQQVIINMGENLFNEQKAQYERLAELSGNIAVLPEQFAGDYAAYLEWSNKIAGESAAAAEASTNALGDAVDVATQGVALVKALKEIGNQNIEALVTKTMEKVAKAIAHATQIVAEVAAGITAEDLALAESLGGAANTVFGAVTAAVSAFNGMKNLSLPSDAKMNNLVARMQQIVSKFIAKLSGFDTTGLANASVVAESVDTIVNAVGAAVSGFKDLQEVVTFNSSGYINTLISNIKIVVTSFIAGVKGIGKYAVVAAAAKMAEAADTIVSAVGNAASAFKNLVGEITIPTTVLVGQIITSMASVVKQFIAGSKSFATLKTTETAAAFADPISSILGAIGATAQAFQEILTFVAPMESTVDTIISTMEMVINKMVALSNKMALSDAKLVAITSFSNTIEAVASAVTATYEAFFKDLTALDEFRQVINIDQVFGWMEDSLSRMFNLAKLYTGVNIEQIASAADAASKVAEAITSFFGIANETSDNPTRISDAIKYAIESIIEGINQFNTGVSSTGANFVDQLILGMQSREDALAAEAGRLTAILSGVGNTTGTAGTQKLEITHVISDPTGALKNATASEVAALLSGNEFITNLRQSVKTQ